MCPKNPGMPHLSPCLRTGAVRLTATTTVASLSCPSLGRSWLRSSSTASSPTSRRKTCRKPSVDSVQTTAHWHDLLCTPGAGEVHRTEYGPRYHLHRPDESLQHRQQRGPLGDPVQAGLPDQVREPDFPVPRRHDKTGTFRRWSISNGVKQGCVLAPVLFNLFLTSVVNHAIRDLEQGVYLRYRLDGSLFDLRRLTAKTKTVKQTVLEALFADDCALMAHREFDVQIIVNKFAEASRVFGLTISLGKTEVLFQPAPATVAHRPTISTDGTQLKTADDFKYLGSVISSDGSLDKEISARICKASQALCRLKTRVPSQYNISQSTKLKMYRAVVLTSLLYGCEIWTLYRRHLKQLECFHMHSLRTILDIKWQDRVSHLQVLDITETTSIEAMILKSRIRWVGHVICMEDNRLPKQLMFGELASGKRNQGRPLERFKDQGAWAPRSWQDWMASPHQTHHGHIRGVAPHTDRGGPGKKKGVGWCSWQTLSVPMPTLSRIGLHSHLRAHGRPEHCWRASSSISMDYYYRWVGRMVGM